MIEIYQAVLEVLDGGGSAAVCTVVHSAGSSPQKVGSKMLVYPDGGIRGTIGGGAIEQAAIARAVDVASTGRGELFKAHLNRDLAMCCGGRMEIFIEPVGTRPWLAVFGGGHVGAALVEVATQAGFRVHVVDEREAFASQEAHPRAASLTCASPLDVVPDLPWGPDFYAVIVTHSHRLDEELLRLCVAQEHRYLGMIGSRAKVYRFLQRYRARGSDLSEYRDVRAPVGLAVRAREPGEIAVSIVAELIAVRRGLADQTGFESMRVTAAELPAARPEVESAGASALEPALSPEPA